ncbi:MAG: CU044_5270 family protein [Micropruina sp.]|nr:CU044_5270 family protein [Micropruina sp.]
MNLLFEDQMRTSDPGASVPAYDPDERAKMLDEAVAATPVRRSRGRLLLAACAALVVAGLIFQSVTASIGSAQASEVLHQAAIHAFDERSRPGQYWQLTRTGTNIYGDQDNRLFLVRVEHVDYVAVDGKRPTWFVRGGATTVRQLSGPPPTGPVTWSPGDTWTTNLSPEQMPAYWSLPSPSWLAALPRDPAQLRARLYADTEGRGNNHDDEAFTYVADVLRSGIVPADLRSALFEVLRTIPGTTVKDAEARLDDGRVGAAIGRNDIFGSTGQLIVDPDNGQVIGERTVMSTFFGFVGDATLTTGIAARLVDSVPKNVQENARREKCTVENDEVRC